MLKLAAHVEAGVIVIDGGNTYYKDDIRRARALRMHGVHYIDVGTVLAFGVRSSVGFLDAHHISSARAGFGD